MIGGNAMLIYANAAELDQRNMDASSLNLQDVLLLTREACCKGDVPVGDMVEIEAYSDEGSAIVFLRLKQLEKQWVIFSELSVLLDGLTALSAPLCGQMGFWNGAYCLSTEKEGEMAVLSEFGKVPSRRTQYDIERKGALVLKKEGLKRLWSCLRS